MWSCPIRDAAAWADRSNLLGSYTPPHVRGWHSNEKLVWVSPSACEEISEAVKCFPATPKIFRSSLWSDGVPTVAVFASEVHVPGWDQLLGKDDLSINVGVIRWATMAEGIKVDLMTVHGTEQIKTMFKVTETDLDNMRRNKIGYFNDHQLMPSVVRKTFPLWWHERDPRLWVGYGKNVFYDFGMGWETRKNPDTSERAGENHISAFTERKLVAHDGKIVWPEPDQNLVVDGKGLLYRFEAGILKLVYTLCQHMMIPLSEAHRRLQRQAQRSKRYRAPQQKQSLGRSFGVVDLPSDSDTSHGIYESDTGRKLGVRHWVRGHWRKLPPRDGSSQDDEYTWVRAHVRGDTSLPWSKRHSTVYRVKPRN